MKGRNLLLTGLVTLALGILLIVFRTSLSNGRLVIFAGAIFMIAGVLNMTVFLGARDREGKARTGAFGSAFGWIASAAAVVLGLAMVIFSNAFVAIIGFMLGVLILFSALFQMFLLIFGSKPTRLSSWFYLVPTALVGAAIYIFLHTPETDGRSTVMLITGISLMVFGLFTIIEGTAIGQVNRQTLVQLKADEAARLKKDESKPQVTAGSADADDEDADKI